MITPRLLCLLVLPLTLGACEASLSGTPSQVVVRVNSQDISVHQLNQLTRQQGEGSKERRDELLERLVQRELAAQQALAMKLDRQPEGMLLLEEARREALATAWANHLAAGKGAVDQNEAARYFATHPGLFVERKLYRLQELALPADAPLIAEAEVRLHKGERLSEIRSWLTAKGSRFGDREILRMAEQLPIESLDSLRLARPGQTLTFRSPRGLTVYQLKSAELMPIDWSAAAPVIRSYLAAQSHKLTLDSELQRLRKQARIEYPGSKSTL